MDNRLLRKYIKLSNEIRANEDEAERLKEDKAEIERRVLASMEKAGIQSINQDGFTVYVRRELWASAPGPEGIEALRSAGYEEFIRENVVTQSLSAFLRERARENPLVPGQPLELLVPEDIRHAVKVSEKIEARVTKS